MYTCLILASLLAHCQKIRNIETMHHQQPNNSTATALAPGHGPHESFLNPTRLSNIAAKKSGNDRKYRQREREWIKENRQQIMKYSASQPII